MRAFFDSSVLVAAFYAGHTHHVASLAAIQAANKETAFCATHTLAEVYSVMTRLPARPRIAPNQGLLFVEAIKERFMTVALTEDEYFGAIAGAAERGIAGGKIYDVLILRCAEKIRAEAVFTWNLVHFRQLADPELAPRIRAP